MDTTRAPEDRYARAAGLDLRYWCLGSGPRTVLLLHGLGSFVEEWLLTVGPLAARFRVLALDLPGHGRSDMPEVRYTSAFYADTVCAFMVALGVETASLIGRSLGGAVCLELSLRHPELCERLVLLAPPGLGRRLALPLRLLTLPVVGEHMTQRRPRRSTSKAANRPAWMERVPPDVAAALTRARERARGLPANRRALLSTLRESATLRGVRSGLLRSARQRVREIAAPCLLIWGDRDPVVPLAHGQWALGELPDARLEIVPDCGHHAPLEHPDIVNELIIGFLQPSGR